MTDDQISDEELAWKARRYDELLERSEETAWQTERLWRDALQRQKELEEGITRYLNARAFGKAQVDALDNLRNLLSTHSKGDST